MSGTDCHTHYNRQWNESYHASLPRIIYSIFTECHLTISHVSWSLLCSLLFLIPVDTQSQSVPPMHPIISMHSLHNPVYCAMTTKERNQPPDQHDNESHFAVQWNPTRMASNRLFIELMHVSIAARDTIQSPRTDIVVRAIPKDPTHLPSESSKTRPSHPISTERSPNLINRLTDKAADRTTKHQSTDDSPCSLFYALIVIPFLLVVLALHRCTKTVSLSLICLLLLAISLPVQSQPLTFTCVSSYNCSNIQCIDKQDCLVQCIGSSSCRSTTITGSNNGNLDVQCTGSNSCRQTTITANDNSNVTVTCAGSSACYQTVVNGPINGNMSAQCSGSKGCQYADFFCPIHGLCDIGCTSSGANDCMGIIVDATTMISGHLSFESAYSSSGGIIRCPGNSNECSVYCGENGCLSFEIYTEPSSGKLDISATGVNALKSTHIYCPPSAECFIDVSGDSSGMLSDTRIHSIRAFDDNVSLNCNVSNATNCYDASLPPQMSCSSDYGVVCNIALQSGYNDWQCMGGNLTAICNDNTTSGYYGNYFVCTDQYECDSVVCGDNQDCVVQCIGTRSCYGSSTNIIGPSNGDLEVQCLSESSCRLATITTNDNSNFSLICSGSASCLGSKVFGPINGNMSVECSNSKSCQTANFVCPIHGLCDIDCTSNGASSCTSLIMNAASMISGHLSFESVKSSSSGKIHCPGNNNECAIYCGEDGCLSFSFFTQSDSGRLDISASGANALKSAHIHCPPLAECFVDVSGDSSGMLTDTRIHSIHAFDDNASLNCNVSNSTNCYDASMPPQMSCSSDYGVVCNIGLQSEHNDWQCVGHNLTTLCDDNTANGYYGTHFVCNGGYECDSILCSDNQDCVVECIGASGCRGSKVHIVGPLNGDLDVQCLGGQSCRDTTITANDNSNFTLICSGSSSCQQAILNGPINGNMAVQCSGNKGCYQADFICPNYGLCDIDCTSSGTSDCSGVNIDATTTLSGHLSFKSTYSSSGSTIHCPGNNNECIIHCGESGCQQFTFYTQPDTAMLDIDAVGTASLESANIYCPFPNAGPNGKLFGNCSISVFSPSFGVLSLATIYSVNGLQDLSLACYYSSDATDCYAVRPNLVCHPTLDVSCGIILQSQHDGWQCDDGGIIDEVCHWTYAPTSDPTIDPTSDPTVEPTMPTSHPTKGPTADPTTATPTTARPTAPPTTPTTTPADYTLVYRLILDGDFAALISYLDSSNIDVNDFALDVIERLMHPFYFSRLVIRILDVYRGSIVIDYSVNTNGHGISMIHSAIDSMNASINVDGLFIVAEDMEYPIALNERIFNYTNRSEEADDDYDTSAADGVVGLFVFLILICCVCTICGIIIGIMKCILRCLDDTKEKQEEEEKTRSSIRRAIYVIFWIISLPLQLVFAIATRLCFCHGCTRHVGLHFIHLMMNVLSTILLAAHFSFGDEDFGQAVANGVSASFFGGLVSGESIYGLAIIAFALMSFGTKMRKLHQSHREWELSKNETTVSIRIKDIQIVVIGSSDTMFKILSGIAVIIGSRYSGTNVTRNDALKGIVDCIFAAALLGPIKEMTQLLHEYLTVAIMTLPKETQEPMSNKLHEMVDTTFDPDQVKDGIFQFLEKRIADDAYKSKYAEQKTILWNGVWAGLKLLLLAVQQSIGFVAASMLLAVGNDIASFLAFVLICNVCVIVIAFLFCTRFERVSIGLCFKYYLCCLYDQCPTYCEEKWIRLESKTDVGNTNADEGSVDQSDENTAGVSLVTEQPADTALTAREVEMTEAQQNETNTST
eukprot:661263_1